MSENTNRKKANTNTPTNGDHQQKRRQTEEESSQQNLEEIKLLNENEIKYEIYILNEASSSSTSQDIDSIYQEMLAYIEKLTTKYTWNNEKFNLARPSRVHEPYFVCTGTLDFGDNLEDEWFVVYLIVKLTAKFGKKLCAQVNDYDGEFLLIHTANYLPEWASSAADNCMQNRVFIHEGN